MEQDRLIKLNDDRIKNLENKVEKLDEKIELIDDKHDQRHLEMAILTTSLNENSKAARQDAKRMADVMENLAKEIKVSNTNTNKRFDEVKTEISTIKGQLSDNKAQLDFKLEEKKLGNKTLLAILAACVTLIEVFINIIVPLIT